MYRLRQQRLLTPKWIGLERWLELNLVVNAYGVFRWSLRSTPRVKQPDILLMERDELIAIWRGCLLIEILDESLWTVVSIISGGIHQLWKLIDPDVERDQLRIHLTKQKLKRWTIDAWEQYRNRDEEPAMSIRVQKFLEKLAKGDSFNERDWSAEINVVIKKMTSSANVVNRNYVLRRAYSPCCLNLRHLGWDSKHPKCRKCSGESRIYHHLNCTNTVSMSKRGGGCSHFQW